MRECNDVCRGASRFALTHARKRYARFANRQKRRDRRSLFPSRRDRSGQTQNFCEKRCAACIVNKRCENFLPRRAAPRRRRDAILSPSYNRMRSHLRAKTRVVVLHAHAVTLHKICALRREALKINSSPRFDTFDRDGRRRRQFSPISIGTIRRRSAGERTRPLFCASHVPRAQFLRPGCDDDDRLRSDSQNRSFEINARPFDYSFEIISTPIPQRAHTINNSPRFSEISVFVIRIKIQFRSHKLYRKQLLY